MSWSFLVTPPQESAAPVTVAPIDLLAFKDLRLDPVTWDLVIPVELVSGIDAIIQNLGIRLKFLYGEWFKDQNLGITYREQILIAAPQVPVIEQLYRKAILTTPGIASVDSFVSRFEKRERRLFIDDFRAKIVDGSTITLQDTPLLVV